LVDRELTFTSTLFPIPGGDLGGIGPVGGVVVLGGVDTFALGVVCLGEGLEADGAAGKVGFTEGGGEDDLGGAEGVGGTNVPLFDGPLINAMI
jgi:hypothetical protein